MRSLTLWLQGFTISVITLGVLAFPSRRVHTPYNPPVWEKLHHLNKLTLHLVHWSTPSAKHHGSSFAKYTAHVLPWSRLATHTILSSQSFNFHHRLRVQALRSPASAGLPDYSHEQFEQSDKALFFSSFVIIALKGYGRFSSASPVCAAMWWKGWLWLAVASCWRAHVFST